jgi:hypothetical protein
MATADVTLERTMPFSAEPERAVLAALTDGMPAGLDIRHYAETVREMSCLRHTIHKCYKAIERCYEREWKADRIQQTVHEIRQSSQGEVMAKMPAFQFYPGDWIHEDRRYVPGIKKWLEDGYWERIRAEPAVDPRSRDEPGADPIWEYVTVEGQKYARKKTA